MSFPRAPTESIIGGVVRVSVLVTPLGILLVGYMLTDRPRDQNDGCANDESPSYQRFHFSPRIPPTNRRRGGTIYNRGHVLEM